MKKKLVFTLTIMCLITLIQSGVFFSLLNKIRKADEAQNQSQALMIKANDIQTQHYKWLQGLTLYVYSDAEFGGSLDHTACSLGKWLADDEFAQNADPKVVAMMDKLREPHRMIHDTAAKIVGHIEAGEYEYAPALFHEGVIPNMEKTITVLDEIHTESERESRLHSEASDAVYAYASFMLTAISVTSIVIGLVLLALLLRLIIPPLKKMTYAASALAEGNMDIHIDIQDKKDEMGELAHAFQDIIDSTRRQCEAVSQVATGDLTVYIKDRGEQDVLNHSLASMIGQNNKALAGISSMIGKVKGGSYTISASAEQLASGATEQSAATEELSASIGTINHLAVNTNDISRRLIQLTGEMKASAEQSSGQMLEMLQAVQGIQQSSKNIEDISKAIESIAFQTNILALNAAVEAARAGQYGKGFAVVADEVGNLAAQSAEAARQTSKLVAESTSTAEQGVHIAERTEQSLLAMIEQISEASGMISDIGHGNNELTEATRQLQTGIDQVAIVVHTNSATSEELAASSEALSNLAGQLEAIAKTYKLK